MKIKALLLGVVLFSSLQAKSQVITIDTIIETALKHSPDIEIQRLDFKSAKERTKFAQGAYLPRVDLSVAGGKQYSKLKNQSTTDTDILRGTVGASQLLYDFGKTAGRVTGSIEASLALEAQMQQSISDKIFLLKQAYYDILKSKSIIEVQKKNVKLQKQQLHRAKKYLESGIKTIIDVSDAEVQLEKAKLDLNNAQYDLELKRATLEEEMGYVPNQGKYTLYNKKLPKKNLSKGLPKVHTSLSKLEKYAYTHRYAMSASEYAVRNAKANIQTAKGDYYPTLSLNGNYSSQEVDSQNLAVLPQNQGEITVNMNWNIFSGYQSDANTQEAKIELLKASSQVQDVKIAIKKDVIESHILVRQSKDSVSLSESISNSSLKKFDQAEKRYANELSDFVELQDAQQDYITSLSDMVSAYYDYFIAMAKLDHAVGK
jgi:outer membrane protein